MIDSDQQQQKRDAMRVAAVLLDSVFKMTNKIDVMKRGICK